MRNCEWHFCLKGLFCISLGFCNMQSGETNFLTDYLSFLSTWHYFSDKLKHNRINEQNKNSIPQININSIKNKFDLFTLNVKDNIYILLIIEPKSTKLFLTANFYLKVTRSDTDLVENGGVLDDTLCHVLNVTHAITLPMNLQCRYQLQMYVRVRVFITSSNKNYIEFKHIWLLFKNIWLDLVYCKEHCGIHLLLLRRMFGKIFKSYCLNIRESIFLILKNIHSTDRVTLTHWALQCTKLIILFVSYFVKVQVIMN